MDLLQRFAKRLLDKDIVFIGALIPSARTRDGLVQVDFVGAPITINNLGLSGNDTTGVMAQLFAHITQVESQETLLKNMLIEDKGEGSGRPN